MFPELIESPQRVLVTAGAGGLGLVVAQRFLQRGAKVHICDASSEAMARALSDNPGLHGSVADVGDPKDVRMFVKEALQWMEGVDVLANCAGQPGPRARLEEIEDEDWSRTIAVNLSGMFYCIREVAPAMKAQCKGSIINIASHAARLGLPKRAAFVASKAGVLGLTYSVAREFGPNNIRCNVVLPGLIDDSAGRDLVRARARELRVSYQEAEAKSLEHVSMRTWIEAEEVADVVCFLASDEARHVTGQTLGVCGNLEWE